MVRLRGWGHIVLKVSDLARARTFYEELLGFRVVGSRPGMLFLRCSEQHHDLALLAVPFGARSEERHLGLFHFALAVPTYEDLLEAYRFLAAHEVPILGAADHLVSKSFYFEDPDGNEIELYADEPRSRWGSVENPFTQDFPLRLNV